jgi:molecular chaperone IbpA
VAARISNAFEFLNILQGLASLKRNLSTLLKRKSAFPYRQGAGPSGLHVPRGPAIPADHRMSLKGGYAMRTFDLAPLYRSTVGFDRLFSMLDGFDAAAPGYPPYNIERTGENDYRITVAVAGFADSELSIEAKENTLTIKGEKQVKQENNGEVLYQGIAARAFERQFQLADHVQVKGANLENGLLHVDLVREIPEAKKPRQIAINGNTAKPKVVESQAAAA